MQEEYEMTSHVPPFPTVGEIARRLSVPVHRIVYVLRSRDIPPAGRAGNARVFRDTDVAVIEAEIRRIDGAKTLSTGIDSNKEGDTDA